MFQKLAFKKALIFDTIPTNAYLLNYIAFSCREANSSSYPVASVFFRCMYLQIVLSQSLFLKC